ncbi:hypothetical protein AX774_g5326 [Zancudomyces culisetae]|uniref:Uncharacterized protein n=1 Tax=Zancudomyces culisetae TaxID=1213189 RepID=A0A1R1PJS6_ZANCU|nr:hypothetical protein AX774_g5326 [Zancudomyces culisetae]|eukprot:OMH81225.1 hypothetical protein AX774_g5326 [Zancudomyces culisetae]
MTSLLGAIRAGSVELVQQIIDVGGLKVADSGFKGLRMACDHKNIEMIMLLMKNGASVCGQEKYLLTGVCTNNIYEIMQHILSVSYRIDKNQNGNIQDKKDKGQKACVDKVLEHLVVYGLGLDRDVYKKDYGDSRVCD